MPVYINRKHHKKGHQMSTNKQAFCPFPFWKKDFIKKRQNNVTFF